MVRRLRSQAKLVQRLFEELSVEKTGRRKVKNCLLSLDKDNSGDLGGGGGRVGFDGADNVVAGDFNRSTDGHVQLRSTGDGVDGI